MQVNRNSSKARWENVKALMAKGKKLYRAGENYLVHWAGWPISDEDGKKLEDERDAVYIPKHHLREIPMHPLWELTKQKKNIYRFQDKRGKLRIS